MGIPSRDGASRLARLLPRLPAAAPFLVVDAGSPSALPPGRREAGCVLDRAALDRFAEHLGKGDHLEAARLALGLSQPRGWTVGGSRNALGLLATGHRLLSLDDDVLPIGRAGSGSWTLGRGDPTGWHAWPGPADAIADLAPEPLDLLGECRCLGARVPFLGPNVRVALLRFGFAGHAGWSSILPLLQLRGAALDAVAASNARFAEVVTRGGVTRAAVSPTVGRAAFFMSMAFGADYRQALPPFPPEGRAADAPFGALCATLLPDSAVAWSATRVVHDPIPERTATLDDLILQAVQVRPADLFVELAREAREQPEDRRRTWLVARCRALAAAPEADRRSWLRATQDRVFQAHLARILAPIGGAAPGSAWRETQQRTAALFHQSVNSLSESLIQEAPRLIGQYGMVLDAWPTLQERANDASSPLERALRLFDTGSAPRRS